MNGRLVEKSNGYKPLEIMDIMDIMPAYGL